MNMILHGDGHGGVHQHNGFVNVNGVKTEILFIERCLALLKPGGRLGIVLPEGIFNNPSLELYRCFVAAPEAFLEENRHG
jgi:hypothetical protein